MEEGNQDGVGVPDQGIDVGIGSLGNVEHLMPESKDQLQGNLVQQDKLVVQERLSRVRRLLRLLGRNPLMKPEPSS